MNRVLIVLLLTFAVSCSPKQGVRVEIIDSEHTQIVVDGSPRYLLLPVEDRAPIVPITVDGVAVVNVRLAVDSVEYYVPLEVDSVAMVKGLADGAIARQELKVSDWFDTSNREQHRPIYHFTPPYGWMNDPNGMLYHDGIYHLCYQYNPYGSTWENMSWGHATSSDLVTWQDCGVVLRPDNIGAIFSGSSVVDHDNVAGFGRGAIISYYTSFMPSKTPQQVQSMAYSCDGGNTYTKYDGNPILVEEGDPIHFRDPKVFYHKESQRWIMSTVAGHCVKFYSSANLKEWRYESTFGGEHNNPVAIWECPDLVEMSVDGDPNNCRWVLILCPARTL